jgi:hypothetical protein
MYNLGKATERQDDHAHPREIVTQSLANGKPYRDAEVDEVYDESRNVDDGAIHQTLLYCHVQRPTKVMADTPGFQDCMACLRGLAGGGSGRKGRSHGQETVQRKGRGQRDVAVAAPNVFSWLARLAAGYVRVHLGARFDSCTGLSG